MQIFSLLQGSEAQRTTDLLLLRFSSHWPHPLSFNRFAFAAHAALPLFTFCLFPHVQNVRLLLYLCSRFSASAFVPLYRHILKSLLISFITFPGSRRTFEAPPLQILPQEFPPRLSLSPSEYFPRAEPLRSFTETFFKILFFICIFCFRKMKLDILPHSRYNYSCRQKQRVYFPQLFCSAA